MEFQAAHIGGALLMPRPEVSSLAGQIAMRAAKRPPLPADSGLARALIDWIARRCRVSEQAARVRLLRLALLVEDQPRSD
jgi:Zn-dependent peptidase ImmA (M78 family)